MAFTLSPESEKIVDELLTRYPTKRATCLPILHLCQRQLGWISPDVIRDVALLVDVANNLMRNTICAFADGTAVPMLGFLHKFRDEFIAAAGGGVAAGTLRQSSLQLVRGGRG